MTCPTCGRVGAPLIEDTACLDCLLAQVCCPNETEAARSGCGCRGIAALVLERLREVGR